MILAGDIGGTNTRLSLFNPSGDFTILLEEKFPSKEAKGLEEIALRFLQNHPAKISAACFAIAGPVRDQVCKTTNLPWIVDAKALKKALKIPSVRLVNDLEANANGLKILKPDELYCLQRGQIQNGHQALIAAGTGLGEAGLFWNGQTHQPIACEGGHSDFSPRNELEVELLFYLQKKFGHVSFERVVSGMGITSIYEFLTEVKGEKIDPIVQREMATRNPAAVICECRDPVSKKTVDWFLSLYGAESGNLALKYASLGGFYVGGGIAPRLVEKFKSSEFLTSFSNKGRFKEFMESMPIHIVLNDNAALLGAASFGREL